MMNPNISENVKENTLQKHEILPLISKDLRNVPVMQRYLRSDNNTSLIVHLRPHKASSVEGNKLLENARGEYHNMSLKGLRDGCILIAATIAVYILVCIVVFLHLLWLSKRSDRGGQLNFVGTSNISENSVLIQTPTTLISYR